MAHHHHKRGTTCQHGLWATTGNEGHHHHKRDTLCVHGLWATDSINGHHHHKRGGACFEHEEWATSEEFLDILPLMAPATAEDPKVVYDLSHADRRSYQEIEA